MCHRLEAILVWQSNCLITVPRLFPILSDEVTNGVQVIQGLDLLEFSPWHSGESISSDQTNLGQWPLERPPELWGAGESQNENCLRCDPPYERYPHLLASWKCSTILKPMPKTPRTQIGRALRVSALVAPGILLLSGCSKIPGFGFRSGLSSVNDTSLSLWQAEWITAAIVGVFTAGLIIWAAIFHRKKNDDFPRQNQYHIPVEVAYTLIPFIIVAVLFGYTARDESRITSKSPTNVMHDISVNGIQWSWQFTYPEAGANATVTGTPTNRPILYLPQGELVRFTITSSDVVHGFWIPAFMIQMQALPGVTNHLQFTANKIGSYPGRCNILCGREHSSMIFTVKVVTPAEYQSYLSTLKASQL
jgi:cytochrome c oxidase subunit 2